MYVHVHAHACTFWPTPCSIWSPLWALHSSPGEKGNDTFVASNKQWGMSNALSSGSGWAVGGWCCGGEEGGVEARSLISTASADLIISNYSLWFSLAALGVEKAELSSEFPFCHCWWSYLFSCQSGDGNYELKLAFASKIVIISIVVVVIHKKVEEDCAGDIQTMAWGLNLASWPWDSSWHGICNSQEIKAYFEHDHF